MKSLYRIFLASVFSTALLLVGCKDDNYVTDGGLHKSVTQLSNYDYLKTSSQFDTLILIVDHFGLKDSLNNAGTFYAFTDYAATSFMRNMGLASMDELYSYSTSKFIKQYMFSKTISMNDVSVKPVVYQNQAEPDSTNCAILKTELTQKIDLTNSSAIFKYYRMQYRNINGKLDDADNPVPDDPGDVTSFCQTVDIQTSSGKTRLHIFANNVSLKLL